jgi:hypothetical protein
MKTERQRNGRNEGKETKEGKIIPVMLRTAIRNTR